MIGPMLYFNNVEICAFEVHSPLMRVFFKNMPTTHKKIVHVNNFLTLLNEPTRYMEKSIYTSIRDGEIFPQNRQVIFY